MDQNTHNKIVSFIWGIADDVLRDLFKRGKYPDVILPMCVIRRMDAVLEPTKKNVLDTKKMLDKSGITEQGAALRDAAGQSFYNTSKFTLRDLQSRGSQQQLLADFEDYLNGFSPNVQDIIENFKLRNQLSTLSKADALGTLINKFLDPEIDLSPARVDNHSMGTVFEELVRRFNEENNEEAGEHWTPRDAVRLMANLVFLPIEGQLKSGTYLLYDCACGTGGMLTVGEETLTAIAAKRKQDVKSVLYGQEINPETYAVCKADMLLKGESESADHIVGGAEWSTLSHDAFPAQEFDFMLANPPYGKGVNWYYLGRWRSVYEATSRAARALAEEFSGVPWELSTARLYQVYSLFYLGDFPQHGRLAREYLRDALDRGNLFAATIFRSGLGNTAWLVTDQVDEARRMVREAAESWPQEEFRIPHFLTMLAEGQLALYAGEGSRAQSVVANAWRGFKRSHLTRIQNLRINSLHLRARGGLVVAARDRSKAAAGAVERDIALIEGENMP